MMIREKIGKKINIYRRAKKMTLEELSQQICKSKSTLSKYEKGAISIDIETLYDIASALNIHVEQLLYITPQEGNLQNDVACPAFFKDLSRFYAYYFDGRDHHLDRSVFDVLSRGEEGKYRLMMYMNFKNYDSYQDCENTYWGYIQHFDAMSRITLTNKDTPMENVIIQVLASFLDSPVKWGLFTGFSSRPMMPVALKILLSKQPLKEEESLVKKLKVSREDVRNLKHYNMLSVT